MQDTHSIPFLSAVQDRSAVPPSGENRRGFLGQAVAVLCGGAALLVPAAVGIAGVAESAAAEEPERPVHAAGLARRAARRRHAAEGARHRRSHRRLEPLSGRADRSGVLAAQRRRGAGAASDLSRTPAARSTSRARPQAASSSALAMRPVSTWPASGRTRLRPAPATWTRWRWRFATRTRCGSSFRPSASARPQKVAQG